MFFRTKLISLVALLGLCGVPSGAEPVYALHFQFDKRRPDWREWYEAEFARAKALGYTHVFLKFGSGQGAYRLAMGAGSSNGAAPEDLSRLIRHATGKLGLEVVLEAKLFGKQRMTMGDLIEKRPGLVISGKVKGGMGDFQDIWNPRYRCPDGRDLYEGVVGPLLDELLSLYGDRKARWFLFGWDELDKEALVEAARAEGLSPAQLWAREWNRSVKLILDRGVTPMAWGDCFLSERLAKPGLVKGFGGDPRFVGLKDMNGDPSWTGNASLIEGVDAIGFRDRVILIDWHYFGGSGPSAAEFPSVDYFQALGFKDVWIATWYQENAIRAFSKYGHGRKVGGYVATFWYLSTSDVSERYEATFTRSLPLFKDPQASLPSPKPWFARGQVPNFRASFSGIEAELPGMPSQAALTVQWRRSASEPWGEPFRLKPISSHTDRWITADGTNPAPQAWSDLRLGVSAAGETPQYWLFGSALQPTNDRPGKALPGNKGEPDYLCDYSMSSGLQTAFFMTEGAIRCMGQLSDARFDEKGLRLGPKGAAVIPKNAYFWEGCRTGIAFEVVFTMDALPSSNAPWEGILSMGNYNDGVRVLLFEGKLQAQLAGRSGKPFRLGMERPVRAGERYAVFFSHDRAGGGALLRVNGKEAARLQSDEILPFDEGGPYQAHPIVLGAGNAEGGGTRNPLKSGRIHSALIWSHAMP